MARKHTWQFISGYQRRHVPWNLGSELFFRMRAFPLAQLYADRFVPASLRFLRWPILEVALFPLICRARHESKVREKKWPRELQGFRSTRQEGSKSRITLCYLCESRIPTLWKHEIPLPLVILIPASRPSFELKSRISRRKNAESGRIPPNLLGTLWNRKCASFSLLRILITRLHLKFLPMKLRKNYKNIAFRGGPAATALLWLIVYE